MWEMCTGATESRAGFRLCEQGLVPPAGSPERKHPIPTWQRYYMVAIFTLTASLLYADQNLMAPNLTAIAEEFHFTEEEKVK